MSRFFLILCFAFLLCLSFCKGKDKLAAAKKNAESLGQTKCECEKKRILDPKVSLDACIHMQSQLTRYININFEFAKASDTERREVMQIVETTLTQCMKKP